METRVRCTRGDMNQVDLQKELRRLPVWRVPFLVQYRVGISAVTLLSGDRTVPERPEVTSDIDVTLQIVETLLHLSKNINI